MSPQTRLGGRSPEPYPLHPSPVSKKCLDSDRAGQGERQGKFQETSPVSKKCLDSDRAGQGERQGKFQERLLQQREKRSSDRWQLLVEGVV